MALWISIRRQTGGLAPCRFTFTRCTLVAACFGKSGNFSMATRLPPTNLCSLQATAGSDVMPFSDEILRLRPD
jgi:hypothetical protein